MRCSHVCASIAILLAQGYRALGLALLPTSSKQITRRELTAGLGTAAFAAMTRGVGADAPNSDVVVIGASGRTGQEVVRYCVRTGRSVRACTRSGLFNTEELLGSPSNFVTPAYADVTRPKSLESAVMGASIVIFAATASAFGTPSEVDDQGLTNTAKACIAAQVPRLVVVSGAGVTKIESPAYRFLNLFGGRMDAKLAGEATVRSIYASAPSSLAYTIVRPSGLMLGVAKGPGALELNQGDEVAGSMSRADVAAVCVECALSEAAARTTFECYDAGTGLATQSLSLSGILSDPKMSGLAKRITFEQEPLPTPVTGYERRAEDFATLFSKLEPDSAASLS